MVEMSGTIATRDERHPQDTLDREAVLRELHEILASHHFCNSKRYPAMLKYIVENTLAGQSDHLKERTIGVEVFDRPPTYDTNSDTVVRYTAGEVRKRLLLYYSESGRNSAVRISLPAGSYIPEFHHGHDLPAEHGDDANFVPNIISMETALRMWTPEKSQPVGWNQIKQQAPGLAWRGRNHGDPGHCGGAVAIPRRSPANSS
jgi:hypothetical protein